MPAVVAELSDTQLTRKMSAEEFEIDSQPNIAEMLIKKTKILKLIVIIICLLGAECSKR